MINKKITIFFRLYVIVCVCEKMKDFYSDQLKLYKSHLIEIEVLDHDIDILTTKMATVSYVHNHNFMCEMTKHNFTQEHYQCFINFTKKNLISQEGDMNGVYNHIWRRMNDPVFLKYFIEHSGIQPSLETIRPQYDQRVRLNSDLNECFTIILHQLQKNHTTYEPSKCETNLNSSLLSHNDSLFGNYYEPLLPNGKIMDQYRVYLSAGWKLDDGVLTPAS